MSDETGWSDSSSTHTVRPRWTWGGLLALLLGVVLVGVGMMLGSLVVILIGLVLLAVGGVAALRGGLQYDVRTVGNVGAEITEVTEGNVHEAPGPSTRLHDPQADHTSAELEEQRKRILDDAMRAERPSLRPVGAVLVLTVCVWLLVAQWSVYPTTFVGQNNALRDLGVGIVLALAALRLGLVGRSPRVSAVVALGGVALVLFGLVMPHDSVGIAVSEIICGVLVLVSALLTLDRTDGARATS